jgi:hypothetical protein
MESIMLLARYYGTTCRTPNLSSRKQRLYLSLKLRGGLDFLPRTYFLED